MRTLARDLGATDLVVVSLAGMVMLLPSLFLVVIARDLLFALKALAESVVFVLLLFAVLGSTKPILWFSMIFGLLLPGEIYFIATYGYPSSRHTVSLLTESSLDETLEFLTGVYHWLFLSTLAILLLFGTLLRLTKSNLRLPPAARYCAAAVLFGLLLGLEVVRAVPWASQPVRFYSIANAFPVGLAYRIGGYLKYAREGQRVAQQLTSYRFDANSSASDLTVVLIIGESARPDHWALNGYKRDTTPLLSRQPNLVSFPDMVTPWALTTYSVPILITRKEASSTDIFPEKSIVAAAAEAGFHTYWFANQDGLKEVSIHRGEAATRRTYNMAVVREDVDAALDGDMLPDIDSAIADGRGKRLILVHMKGSHWDYHRRYPTEFRQFVPDRGENGGSVKHDPDLRERLVNGYDNSIRYTDYFIDHVLQTLSKTGQPAVLLYVSDHGQALYDQECKLFGHYNDTEINFRTQAMIWFSDSMIERRGSSWMALEANHTRPLTTEGTIFHTVADALQLNIVDRSSSLLSDTFTPQQRRVNVRAGTIDFDRAKRSGACNLLSVD